MPEDNNDLFDYWYSVFFGSEEPQPMTVNCRCGPYHHEPAMSTAAAFHLILRLNYDYDKYVQERRN